GYMVLFERAALPLLTDHCWREDGSLELIGRYSCADLLSARERASAHIVVRSRAHGAERAVPMEWAGNSFRVVLTPASMATLAGDIALAAGRWDFFLRREDPSEVAPDRRKADLMTKVEQSLISTLPQEMEENGRGYELQAEAYDRLSLLVRSAMA
ncbi:CDP-glycerol:glycerophosphate glycerophosphotransferase, partial [Streptomyces lunaelactis]|nr:CDP-glycerol:glycerophosphate glycerophosphotransferase [Streptomyces lunaelactis]